MNYRDKSRKYLSDLEPPSPPRHPQPFTSNLHLFDINERINQLLSSPELAPLLQFLNEYTKRFTIKFGFLYDPMDSLPSFTPILQASQNPRSQAYCARILLDDNKGDIFIIPLRGQPYFTIVLKPARPLRRDFQIKKTTINGFPVTVVFPPYAELDDWLSAWSLIIEAVTLYQQ